MSTSVHCVCISTLNLSVEYGWNDPPSFSYNSLQTGATKRTQLTKRVNHEISTPSQTLSKPLSTVATTCVSHTIPGPPTEAKSNPHPPPLQSETANPPESIINQSELRTESSTDSVQCFDTVIENLGNVVKKHSESMQVACIGLQIVVEKTTLSVYTVNLYMYV